MIKSKIEVTLKELITGLQFVTAHQAIMTDETNGDMMDDCLLVKVFNDGVENQRKYEKEQKLKFSTNPKEMNNV